MFLNSIFLYLNRNFIVSCDARAMAVRLQDPATPAMEGMIDFQLYYDFYHCYRNFVLWITL